MTVRSLVVDKDTHTPVVILEEVDGERVLPIYIGPSEAHAIAMQLASIGFPRPLTHDLLVSVLAALEGELRKVVITSVEKNTYYAELIVRRGDQMITVDARPSDSIAVALRVDAPIFAAESLLNGAQFEPADEDALSQEIEGAMQAKRSEGMRADELEEHLRRLNPEDFGRFKP